MINNRATEIPPTVIRGESLPEGEILIDTLSLTLPRSSVEQATGEKVCLWSGTSDSITALFDQLLVIIFGPGVFAGIGLKGGRNFFDHSIPLDHSHGFIAFGGNNKVQSFDGSKTKTVEERVQVYLSGEGCAKVPDWGRVAKRLEELGARITRVDIAFDDHVGVHDVELCHCLYDAGEFTSQGRPPKASKVDDLGSNDGKTFYVGNRKNGKLLRCYEKGKQLGDPNSPWVRWEVEIHAKDRVIPFDVLTSPVQYLAGSYPALSFISEIVITIKTAKIKLGIQYNKLKNICRTQYGKLLNFAHLQIGLTPEQTFYELLNPKGFPERLVWAAG